MNRAIFTLLCLVTAFTAFGESLTNPEKFFASPDRISYVGNCMTIDGED